MAHNIDMTNNRANIAFLGDRADIWHGLGTGMAEGQSIQDWALAAGLGWQAVKVPLWTALQSLELTDSEGQPIKGKKVEGKSANVRSDTGEVLGIVSEDIYTNVQPIEILQWFERYISVDPRFKMDVAGSLKGGQIIWATALFDNGKGNEVMGEKHMSRLLMTTTFDGTGSTTNQATTTRVVCNNTLNVSLWDKRAQVKTRHSTNFKAEKVGRELASIANGFDVYRNMAEALASVEMSKDQVSKFFKVMLDIPFDAKKDDISTRRMNQFEALNDSYVETVTEGTTQESGWAALNAVTRYVDHSKTIKPSAGNGDMREARILSTQFGSGATMKEKAVSYLVKEFDISDRLKAIIAEGERQGSRLDNVVSAMSQPGSYLDALLNQSEAA